MRSYEVQVRRSGQWKTDSTYDDRELAEVRARQMDVSDKADPVRVVEEIYNDRTKKYQLRTIYRGKGLKSAPQAQAEESLLTRASTTAKDRPAESKDSASAKQPDTKKEPARAQAPAGSSAPRRGTPPPKSGAFGAWALLGVLALLVGLGIGAIVALEYFLKQA